MSLAILAWGGLALVQGRELFEESTLTLAGTVRAHAVVPADLDGDGRTDLVVAVSDERAPEERGRSVRLYLQRAGLPRFLRVPDHVCALTPDVTAFAVGDVHPDPGAELVLFNARGAFAWRRLAEEGARYEELVGGVAFLWQRADPDAPLAWRDGVRDWDGDGRDDLLLPEPDGYRLVLQGTGAGGERFARGFRLELPRSGTESDGVRRRRERGAVFERRAHQFSVGFSSSGEPEHATGPLLSLSERLPAPVAGDWDGDGDLDLLAQSDDSVLVWTQAADGSFASAPAVCAALPLAPDFERRFDVAFAVAADDLDGDGRTDFVIVAGDKRTDELKAQVLVFLQARAAGDPPFGEHGEPSQLLVLAGLVGGQRLLDVDGDGRLDLVCGALRPDKLDQLSSLATKRVEGELYVFLNRGGAFARRPDVTLRVVLVEEGLEGGGRFVADVGGDGVAELLTRDDPGRLRLRLSRRGRDELGYLPRPAWELAVHEDAELVFVPNGRQAPAAFVVVEPGRIRFVQARSPR